MEHFYSMVTNVLCSAFLKVIRTSASGNNYIFLILAYHSFNTYDCFSYNGEKYTYHRDSVNDHYDSKLGDIGNKVLAVGSYSPSDNKVELFDIDSNTWTSKASFPFCSTR